MLDLTDFENDMEELSLDHGLEFKKRSKYHYQLKGLFLLNIYPTTRAVYVQGSNGKTSYSSLEELAELANGDIELSGVEKGKRVSGGGRRRALWDSGERKCFVCGKEFKNRNEATLEHRVPLSRGGSNRRDNLALSHNECNQSRGNSLSISSKA